MFAFPMGGGAAPASTAHSPAASTTAIKAIPVAERSDGMTVINTATADQWIFDADSAAPASSSVLVPDAGTGRWLLDPSTIGVSAAASAEAIANAAQADATSALAMVPKVVNGTITHATLAGGSTQTTINVGAVPASARLMGINVVVDTLFSGGGVVTLTMDLGWAGSPTAIMNASVATIDLIAGTPSLAFSIYGSEYGDNGDLRAIGGQTLQARFITDGGHTCDDLTAGSVTVEISYFVPA